MFGSSMHVCHCIFLPTILSVDMELQFSFRIQSSTEQFVLVLDQLEALKDAVSYTYTSVLYWAVGVPINGLGLRLDRSIPNFSISERFSFTVFKSKRVINGFSFYCLNMN